MQVSKNLTIIPPQDTQADDPTVLPEVVEKIKKQAERFSRTTDLASRLELKEILAKELTPPGAIQLNKRIKRIRNKDAIKVWRAIEKTAGFLRVKGVDYSELNNCETEDAKVSATSKFSQWVDANKEKLSELYNIDLSRKYVSQLPKGLDQFKELNCIELNHNQLTEFPEGMDQLTVLKEVSLMGNPPENFSAETNETIAKLEAKGVRVFTERSFCKVYTHDGHPDGWE